MFRLSEPQNSGLAVYSSCVISGAFCLSVPREVVVKATGGLSVFRFFEAKYCKGIDIKFVVQGGLAVAQEVKRVDKKG